MTRRPAIIAAAALAVFGLVAIAPTANALTTQTKQCIKVARAHRSTALQDARTKVRDSYEDEFTSCFGPGAQCASTCLSAQLDCQSGVTEAPAVVAAKQACKDAFSSKLDECRGEDDPTSCAATARLTLFGCNQDVAASTAGPLDACNVEFGECTAACASAR